ncbi:MAG: hypothetical protein R2761_03085 [Acidimicrobiales bacterium]
MGPQPDGEGGPEAEPARGPGAPGPTAPGGLAARLAAAGFLAAEEEAEALTTAAGDDDRRLEELLSRRLRGEPLAWIVGHILFAGHRVTVTPGVYVPRPHTETVAARAVLRLPADGVAVDACTGSGAVALALSRARPAARVVATDVDPSAVACARANGIDARVGDLLAPVPAELAGGVDVVVAVVPYVPTPALPLLQRDTFRFETPLAYDGGPDGARLLRRLAIEARALLRPGGHLVAELGGDQAEVVVAEWSALGYRRATVLADDDGDLRAVEARWG